MSEGDHTGQENGRFCQNCGSPLPHDVANFCPSCGAAQTPTVEVPTGPPPTTPEAGPISTPTAPGVPPPPEQSGGRRRAGLIVGGCAVLLLLLLGFVACAVVIARGGGEAGEGATTASSELAETSDNKEGARKRKTPTKQETKKEGSENKTLPPAREPALINLSGNGQMATAPFQLESGLAILKMSYQGDRNFIVQLLDQSGKPVGISPANEIGAFQGSQAVKTKAGEHVLNVQASGLWTVTITQPRPSSAPDSTSFSGNTKTATDFFHLSSGMKRFSMAHEGGHNFIVHLLDKNGDPIGITLVNEIGPFNGSKAVRIPKDDIYLLQIEADGAWTIQVE